jgi:hypothetical protein
MTLTNKRDRNFKVTRGSFYIHNSSMFLPNVYSLFSLVKLFNFTNITATSQKDPTII